MDNTTYQVMDALERGFRRAIVIFYDERQFHQVEIM